MKLRTGFVTNSSSYSNLILRIRSKKLIKWLNEYLDGLHGTRLYYDKANIFIESDDYYGDELFGNDIRAFIKNSLKEIFKYDFVDNLPDDVVSSVDKIVCEYDYSMYGDQLFDGDLIKRIMLKTIKNNTKFIGDPEELTKRIYDFGFSININYNMKKSDKFVISYDLNTIEYFNKADEAYIDKLFIGKGKKKTNQFEGKHIVLTGKLLSMTREQAINKLKSMNAIIQSEVNNKTNILIVGDKPGSKLEKAKQLGIKIISENDVLNLDTKQSIPPFLGEVSEDGTTLISYSNKISLKNVVVPRNITKIMKDCFKGCDSIETISIEGPIIEVNDSTFASCSSLKYINLPASVSKIGKFAFYRCSALKEIIIPNSVKEIGNYAFDSCSALKRIIIPNSVKEIGNYAFYECENLEEVVLGSGVASIGIRAFAFCKKINNIRIPKTVKNIKTDAFYGCVNLVLNIDRKTALKSWSTDWNTHGSLVYWSDGSSNEKEIESIASFIVEVTFPNNKTFKYNSSISVKVGDKVKVTGAIKDVGIVKSIEKGWNYSHYMKEIVEVID